MPEAYHLVTYPPLDHVDVARIVDGYGIEAAFERWSPWSHKAIAAAATSGRKKLNRMAAESGATRQPTRDAGGRDPAGVHGRPQFSDSASLNGVFGLSGPRRCPAHA